MTSPSRYKERHTSLRHADAGVGEFASCHLQGEEVLEWLERVFFAAAVIVVERLVRDA
jgi:hypothetical protein